MTEQADAVREFINAAGVPDDELLEDLKELIRDGANNMPRSQQVELGPSEIGTECLRQLAFGILEVEPCNTDSDPLASLFGIGMHELLARFAEQANERLGRVRWLAEKKVGGAGVGRRGTSDLYDIDTRTVVDWKCPGVTRFRNYVKNGPSAKYRGQLHIYGHGWEELGVPVDRVAICWLGRSGTLEAARLWAEPYSRALAEEIFARVDGVIALCDELRVDDHPENFELIPPTPSDDCRFCDWWAPIPQSPLQCPGKNLKDESIATGEAHAIRGELS